MCCDRARVTAVRVRRGTDRVKEAMVGSLLRAVKVGLEEQNLNESKDRTNVESGGTSAGHSQSDFGTFGCFRHHPHCHSPTVRSEVTHG